MIVSLFSGRNLQDRGTLQSKLRPPMSSTTMKSFIHDLFTCFAFLSAMCLCKNVMPNE